MAGHSKFKNIMHRKGAQDKKRAKIFTRALKEVSVAAKAGPDEASNPRLRAAISAAKAVNVPKDKIQNAIDKASSSDANDNLESIDYEGYASGGVAIIIEAVTDNRNRTVSEIRSTLNKNGGSLAESGAVSFMFKRVGLIEYDHAAASEEEMMEIALECGAEDCYVSDTTHRVVCTVENFSSVMSALEDSLEITPILAGLAWIPTTHKELEDEEKIESIVRLISSLEDLDDVQNVFTNMTGA